MIKKLLTISFLMLLVGSVSFSQGQKVILKSNGELVKLRNAADIREAITKTRITAGNGKVATNYFHKVGSPLALPDTLDYRDKGTWNTNFGFFGQDVFIQPFIAEADLDIKAIGFTTSDDEGAANAQVAVRLIKLNWTAEQVAGFDDAEIQMGYYPSDGDGFNNIDFFGENASGAWNDLTEGAYPTPPWDFADYDLWSDEGDGWPITPVASESDAPVYQWVDTAPLGEPSISAGDVFAVVIMHLGNTLDGDRIGFWSATSDVTSGVQGWKYYENPRTDAGTEGWWVRAYTWDFAVAAEITSDRPPKITGITQLITTIKTNDRVVEATIVDDNPSGGPAGVASASLWYSIDGGDYVEVAMTGAGDVYSGTIPGQPLGTEVSYKISAVDVEGYAVEAEGYAYKIFEPMAKVLAVLNGYDTAEGNYLAPYYFYGIDEAVDVWTFGPVEENLYDSYNAVFEIHSYDGPTADNRDEARRWLDANENRMFFVAGQEFLGAFNDYTDSVFVDGDYEKDVLGVAESFNDVTYAESGDQNLPSIVSGVAGTTLGDSLSVVIGEADTMWFDPYNEYDASNWMDQFAPVAGTEVFMNGISLDGTERNVAHMYMRGTNRIVFMTLDPLWLNASIGGGYAWIGGSSVSPLPQSWPLVKIVDVEKTDDLVPAKYALSQNYPNPFNPTTIINYSIPNNSVVRLSVYDMLGRKVAELINEEQAAGSYKVNWNGVSSSGARVASGTYFYRIEAGDFVQTMKMMLLK